jgi:hypothetical protein
MNTYGYAMQNPGRFIDPLGLLSYNKGPPDTVRVPDDVEAKVRCIEDCMGRELVITGGAEQKGHLPGSKHYSGEAVDIGFNSNPGIQGDSQLFFCCAGKCGFKYGQTEGNHYHIQVVPGKNGGSGEILNLEPCTNCP